MKLTLKTSAFNDGDRILSRYTCDDKDISPAFEWEIDNKDIKSFALLCNDINAVKGSWVHWLIFNIPGNERTLPENIPRDPVLSNGAVQAINDFGRIGYGGPCPHSGNHNYIFTLYGLNSLLPAKRGMTKDQFENLIIGKTIEQTKITGTYQKT